MLVPGGSVYRKPLLGVPVAERLVPGVLVPRGLVPWVPVPKMFVLGGPDSAGKRFRTAFFWRTVPEGPVLGGSVHGALFLGCLFPGAVFS